MPLVTYLKPETTFLLKAASREGVLKEMVAAVCQTRLDLDAATVYEAVARREEELSTRISEHIALPHGRIPNMEGFVVAVGLSLQTLPWGHEVNDVPVRIVVLVLGDAGRADEHIRILGEIASCFSQPGAVEQLVTCGSDTELFQQLTAIDEGRIGDTEQDIEEQNMSLLQQASALADAVAAGVVIVLGPKHLGRCVRRLDKSRKRPWIIAAPPSPRDQTQEEDAFDATLDIPFRGLSGHQRVDVVILIGLLKDLLKVEERAVCVYGRTDAQQLDSIHVVDLRHQFSELLKLGHEIRHTDIDPEVLYRVLQLANELALEGREGTPVGTIFVVGDYDTATAYSYQIVINPFRGYAPDEKNVLDPSLDETLKEFSVLDGAFLLRGNGEVMSAGTCIHITTPEDKAVSGLGTRHRAGVAISAVTEALAIVVSQSTGTVSVYKSGKQILALTRNRA